MSGYLLLLPEYLLLAGVLWAMFAELLPGRDRGSAMIVSLTAVAAAVLATMTPLDSSVFGGLLVFDMPSRFIRCAAAGLLALWAMWMWARADNRKRRDAMALAGLSTMGTMLLGSATELITIMVALELSTMPAYALIGHRRAKLTNLEGALKYFLLSMMTTLVTMYGFSFLYGISGTTRLSDLSIAGAGALGIFAVMFSLVGVLAKLSAAPFHYWAPDAYAGASARSVAFVSVIPKLGGTIVLIRFVQAMVPSMPALSTVVAVAAAASMLLGNLAALQQHDIRRLMAYSGVAHAGYLMIGVAAGTRAGYASAMIYVLAYALPSMGILLIAGTAGYALKDFAGLSRRRPVIAWCAVVLLLSLIGIPPMLGFFGKLYLFVSALEAGLAVYVILAVLMSVVSAYYYLRIVKAMFFAESGERVTPRSNLADTVIVALTVLTVVLGLTAGQLLTALGV